MAVLALHPGDLYLRTAYLGAADAPHLVEDPADPARFATPSVAALDSGAALLGHPALMTHGVARPGRVLWRYRRATLATRTPAAHDGAERALTSDGFIAFALRRLAWEAGAFATRPPDLAVVVPGDLAAVARARVGMLAEACSERAVSVIPEDDALFAALPGLDAGPWLVASFDDDALRVRIVERSDGGLRCTFAMEVGEAGLASIRGQWLERWNADASALVPDAQAFGDGESDEFERLWRETWDGMNDAAQDRAPMHIVPLVRQSTLLPLAVHVAPLMRELDALQVRARSAVGEVFAKARAAGVRPTGAVVVGEPVLARPLAEALPAPLGIAAARCHAATADCYARGAARLAAAGAGRDRTLLDATPHGLCVLGLSEDGRTVTRPLLDKGAALPARAAFTVVANRDVQRQVSVTLTGGDEAPEVGYRFDFGPLAGQGMQRINVSCEWRADGHLDVHAADRDTGITISCRDRSELAAGVPMAGAAHLRTL